MGHRIFKHFLLFCLIQAFDARANDGSETAGLPLGPFGESFILSYFSAVQVIDDWNFVIEKMLSSNGKSPLVAATYYFNPGSLLRNEIQAQDEISGRSIHPDDESERTIEAGDSDSCAAPDGRKGVCYDAKECTSRGGTPMGTCSSVSVSQTSGGQQGGSNSKGSVCCLCKSLNHREMNE